MKKIVLGLATSAIVTTLAMPASAQLYVGAGLGSSSNQNANGTIVTGGGPVIFSMDTSKTSWKLLAGIQVAPNFGFEVQYTDLGKRDITLQQGALGAQGSVSAEQYSFAGTGMFMFSPGWFVHGKLGTSTNYLNGGRWCVSATACVSSGKENNTSLLWGVGLGHQFTKNWSVKGGYENFGKLMNDLNGNSVTASNVGVNVIYSF